MWRSIGISLGFTAMLCASAEALSLREAVEHTIHTNPSVGSAAANRRASFYQLQQARGAYFPTFDVSLEAGPAKIDRPNALASGINNQWYGPRSATLTARQVLFEGFNRANNLYRAASVIDAAALRVLQESETQALNAIEAYIDIRRHGMLLRIADENVARHLALLSLIETRFAGGKAPRSSVDQSVERVSAAKAVREEIRRAYMETQARFKAVIGLEAKNTHPVGLPRGLPRSRQAAVDIALTESPALQAADADIDVARYEKKQSTSSFLPTIALEGETFFGRDISHTIGRDHEYTARVVVTWNLFDGFIKNNRRRELIERVGQAQLERDVEVRAVVEASERAWASFLTGGARVTALAEQERIARKVRSAYQEEYELDKRSLLDLLDSEASLFSSRFQLESARAVRLFASYQLLAAMGTLLDNLDVTAPAEAVEGFRARVLDRRGIFDVVIEPLRNQ